MPREIKGNAGRKPPEPLPSHDDIDEWMRRQMPDLQNIVKRVDKVIRNTLPDLYYAVNRNRAYYGLSKFGWVIEMVAYDVSVNVVFLGGADFDPPPPLGTTDGTRYLKVTTLAEIDRPELRSWIDQAGHTNGWK